jgi:ribonuclease P protein component
MLPSTKRLSRDSFNLLVSSKDTKVVFNNLGTLKYKKAPNNKASVVISSKHEKLAVVRNKTKRYIYSLFSEVFKNLPEGNEYILYTTKNISKLEKEEIKGLFYELIKKTTK